MKEVLHVLIEQHEGEPFKYGGPLALDTHGIQHVVLQFEHPKRTYKKNGVALLGTMPQQKLLSKKRAKNAACQFCHEKKSAQGLWKHEKYCTHNPKRKKATT